MKYIIPVLLFAMTLIAATNDSEVIYFSFDDSLATGWKTKIREAYLERRSDANTNSYYESIVWLAYTNTAGQKIWGSAEWNQHMYYQGCTGLYARMTAKVPRPFVHKIVVTNASFEERGFFQVDTN